jgi:hypothetical protein
MDIIFRQRLAKSVGEASDEAVLVGKRIGCPSEDDFQAVAFTILSFNRHGLGLRRLMPGYI